MIKKKILFFMTLLLTGMGMQAQSIAENQMDEHFSENKLPYGWFAEGWEVKDNAAQTKEAAFDMNNLFGGDDSYNYLMTPPLSVQSGEVLSFSAKKGKQSGMSSFMGGDSDSTFVVERAVYGEHRWVKVADFTTELDSVYKTFTISNTEAGEYRFRFRAGGNVAIDAVTGFHIDMAAPDIYPAYQGKNIQPVDLGVCKEDTTMTFDVINTGTGTLAVNLSTTDAQAYSLDNSQVSVAAADTVAVHLIFIYKNGHEGRNSTLLTFTTTDERVEAIPLPIDAVIVQQNVWKEDFSSNTMPVGWFTDGWVVKDNVATVEHPSGGSMGMFGGGGDSFYLMTPPLTVSNENDVLTFSIMKPGGGNSMGAMMGGGDSPIIIEKSVYGSGKWEKAKEIGNVDSVFTTKWLSGLEAGEYRFRFLASDSIVIDDVAGFQIDMNAPDMYVVLDSVVVKQMELGTLQADSTTTFTVINTGTGTLGVDITTLDETRLSVAEKKVSVAAGDSVTVAATMHHDDARPGEIYDVLAFTPVDTRILAQAISFHTYLIKSDAWSENFETEYVIEDQTYPRQFPEGWITTGWKLTQGDDNNMMAMLGGGGNEEKSWGAVSDSEEYELITPSLQAAKGDILQFTMETGGGGLPIMAMMGGNAALNVYYNRGEDDDWFYYGTFTQAGTVYIKAPYAGIYRLKFQGSSVTLDNFKGFHVPLESVAIADGKDDQNKEVLEQNKLKALNVTYDRILKAEDKGDGTWAPKAYTACLPYAMDFNAYCEPGKVKVYRLQYIDNYYRHFIFQETSEAIAAGTPFLAVVCRDSINLNAYDVQLQDQPADPAGEQAKVFDYEKWQLENKQEAVGAWAGTFNSIATDDQRASSIYCLTADGSWAKLSTASEALLGFRGFFSASADMKDGDYRPRNEAPANRAADTGAAYLTKFKKNSENSDNEDIPGLVFNGDIMVNVAGTTGIESTIQTIDADGTVRYFDLQGRELNGKPAKGIYIKNGKKHIAR